MKKLKWLAIFTAIISPLCTWFAISACNETAVYASLSRMLWFKENTWLVFFAMLTLFIPMIISFVSSVNDNDFTKKEKTLCKVFLVVSCVVLYIGAIEMMPSSGFTGMTKENVLHGLMSFGGIFMIFLTLCYYTHLYKRSDPYGAMLIRWLLVFTLITGLFAVDNVYDKSSYVIASGISELYILMMLNLIAFIGYYLTTKKHCS